MDRRKPIVSKNKLTPVADRVWVIPDEYFIPLVPNIGIVSGDKSILVIDAGMGESNAEIVFNELAKIPDFENKRLFFTSTHFHPEHNFGSQFFADKSTIIFSEEQKQELQEKGNDYIEMFRGFGEHVAMFLKNAQIVLPDITYQKEATLDLGGVMVNLTSKPAHTKGDQVIYLPEQRVLFSGDLVENHVFAIFPDNDTKGTRWLSVLDELITLDPKVVVPGHGVLSDTSLIRIVKTYLETIQKRTTELKKQGVALEKIQENIHKEMTHQHPDWREDNWIKPAVQNFYSELSK